MAVSSRTPEGLPPRCPVCGKCEALEPSDAGDSLCPSCGHLLWWFRNHLNPHLEAYSTFAHDVGADSLDLVELAMEWERELGITIPDAELAQVRTVADAINLINRLRGRGDLG